MYAELEELPYPISVREMVRHLKETYKPTNAMTFKQAASEFIEFKKNSGIKKSSYTPSVKRMEAMQKYFNGWLVGDFTSESFIEYIDQEATEKSWSKTTQHKVYSLICEFLTHMTHDGREVSVFNNKILPEIKLKTNNGKLYQDKAKAQQSPTIMHIDEVRDALKTLMTFSLKDVPECNNKYGSVKGTVEGEWLGCFVLGVFAGLRPREIQRVGAL